MLQSNKYGKTSIMKCGKSNLVSALYTVLCLPLGLQPFTQHAPAQHLCCCLTVTVAMQRYTQ